LQGSVAKYKTCGGVVDSQSKKGLLLSLSVKKFKIGEYLAKLQARTWLSHALSSSFRSVLLYVYISGFIFFTFLGSSTRHVLACNFAKYLPISNIFVTDRLSKNFS